MEIKLIRVPAKVCCKVHEGIRGEGGCQRKGGKGGGVACSSWRWWCKEKWEKEVASRWKRGKGGGREDEARASGTVVRGGGWGVVWVEGPVQRDVSGGLGWRERCG